MMDIQIISLNSPLFHEFSELARKEWPKDFDIDIKNFRENLTPLIIQDDQKKVLGGCFVSNCIVNETSAAKHESVIERIKTQGYKNISYVVIAKKNRNKGIGKFLLQEVIEKYPRLWLSSFPKTAPFYEKLGFKIISDIKDGELIMATKP